jgi:hypothetical protein
MYGTRSHMSLFQILIAMSIVSAVYFVMISVDQIAAGQLLNRTDAPGNSTMINTTSTLMPNQVNDAINPNTSDITINYSANDTNQTLLAEKVGSIREGIINILKLAVASEVGQNNTESVGVTLIDFNNKTQNVQGLDSATTLIRSGTDDIIREIQTNNNLSKAVFISMSFNSTCKKSAGALEGEECQFVVHLKRS